MSEVVFAATMAFDGSDNEELIATMAIGSGSDTEDE